MHTMTNLHATFMHLPVEIRLSIYEYLVGGQGHKVFEIRNQDPNLYKERTKPHARNQYRVLGRDLARRSTSTTYHLITPIELHPQIIGVNKQIYEETTQMLYSNRYFSFDRDVEAIEPFFSDLSASTQPLIHGLCLTKQGAVYTRDFDRCVWSSTCRLLREQMQIKSLQLLVDGGRPRTGWEGLPEFTAKEFETLQRVAFDQLEWVWELLTIKGIRNLQIEANISHCPPAQSNAMAFFAAFSASIEMGFCDYLKHEMIRDSMS